MALAFFSRSYPEIMKLTRCLIFTENQAEVLFTIARVYLIQKRQERRLLVALVQGSKT